MSTSASPALEENREYQHSARVFKGHDETVCMVAYLKDGKQVISGSLDGSVGIWNAENGEQNECMVHGSTVSSIAISPDERTLAVSGGSGTTTLWDLESKAVVWETNEVRGSRVAFSPDGQLLAVSDYKEIALLDVESGKRLTALQAGEGIWCLAFSPNGTQPAAGSMNGRVQVFDVAIGGTVVGPFKTHADTVASLVFTHDGQQIITASWDKTIRVWNGASGREVGEPMLGHEESISQIALSSNGLCIASASSDHTVRIWDVSTRRQIGDLLRAQDPVGSVAWSLSSLSIIAGDFDGNIHLWTVPPLDDNITAQAPVLNANTPPLPVGSTRALRSRTNSISSSVLNLSAGPLPTPPRPTELDNVTAEENDWEFSTNESFDSVLDLPADGTRPAQRRKRRRRRAAAPVASTSSPPVPTNHQMSPAIISAPRHSPPLANKTTSPPTQTTPDTHAVAGAPAPRIGALRRLWRQRRTLPRWTRRKPHKNCNAPRKSQPIAPSPVPNAPADDIETQSIEVATDHAEAATPKSRIIPRFLARSRRQPVHPTPESIEMHAPPSAHRLTRNAPSRTQPRRQSQSEVVNVAAGRMDQRMAASSNKWTDKIDWLDYICFCMCCPWNKVVSESDSERQQGNRAAAGGSSGSSSGSSLSSRPVNLHDIF